MVRGALGLNPRRRLNKAGQQLRKSLGKRGAPSRGEVPRESFQGILFYCIVFLLSEPGTLVKDFCASQITVSSNF